MVRQRVVSTNPFTRIDSRKLHNWLCGNNKIKTEAGKIYLWRISWCTCTTIGWMLVGIKTDGTRDTGRNT
jgi:hypothetical protein